MGLSIRAYARHRGSLTPPSTRPSSWADYPEADGTLDPVKADQDWARNTDTPRVGTQQRAPHIKVAEAAEPPGSLPAGGTSLLQARTVNEVVKAQTNKVRLAQLKGELVDRPQAIAHVFKLARTERDACSTGRPASRRCWPPNWAWTRMFYMLPWKRRCGRNCRNWANYVPKSID